METLYAYDIANTERTDNINIIFLTLEWLSAGNEVNQNLFKDRTKTKLNQN